MTTSQEMTAPTTTHAESAGDASAFSVSEGDLVMSATGGFNSAVFRICQGRRRHVPSPDWLIRRGLDKAPIHRLDDALLTEIPLGPGLPALDRSSDFERPAMHLAPHEMRELLVSRCSGRGYEFSPGRAPAPVPEDAVTTFIEPPGTVVDTSADPLVPGGFDAFDQMNHIAPGSADYIIAAHVIQLVRDPIKAMLTAYDRLKPGGYLVMTIPDRARTFNSLRSLTSLDHMVADHLLPCRDRDLEHYMEWHRLVLNEPAWELTARSAFYKSTDVHYHTFTHESFFMLLEYLKGQTPWSSLWRHPPRHHDAGNEFYVVCMK